MKQLRGKYCIQYDIQLKLIAGLTARKKQHKGISTLCNSWHCLQYKQLVCKKITTNEHINGDFKDVGNMDKCVGRMPYEKRGSGQ